MNKLMDKPNVILLTIDSLRADMLGCYGCSDPTTPNLDRLVARGIRFDQAITGGSWTQAAFPVLLTSTYASMYGGCLGPLSPERPSPIEALAGKGYTTGGFSTSPLLSKSYGYHRGFRHFVDAIPDETDPPLRRVKGGQKLLRSPLTHFVSGLVGMRTRPARVYVSAEKLTDQVCGWLDSVSLPFFVWAHYMDVHWPYHLDDALTHPKDIAQAWRDLSHLHEVNWNGGTITANQREHYIGLYKQAIQYVDSQVGRLLDYLDNSPHASNTIVIVVSDHGEEFLERGYWGHVEINLHDEILKVPFIMYLPGLTSGQVIQRQVRTLDIMPTILDMCGCSIPDGLEGTSLTPLWAGNGSASIDEPTSISERWRDTSHTIAVRTEAFKYIWNSCQPDQPMLFDLRADPNEQHNVYKQYPEQVRKFQAQVEMHLRRVEQTRPENVLAEPELDEQVASRLRDLGYIE